MSSFQFGREFLRSISLALFVIYQGITFLVFFVRLASCALAQYNIEDRAASEWEGILFRGLGWLVVGAKISAVESAVGFATTSFGVILTRRVLRMIARACLIIGVIKGFASPQIYFSCMIMYFPGLTTKRNFSFSIPIRPTSSCRGHANSNYGPIFQVRNLCRVQ
jgi:hypothetical protein